MAIEFKGVTLHDKIRFFPGHSYGFEDPDAEAYFKAAFGAEDTTEEPDYVFSKEEIDIDPATIHAESRLLVKDIIEHGSVEKAIEAGVKPASNAALDVQEINATAPVEG